MLKRLLPDPFLLFLIGTVLLATFLPARGAFATFVGWLSLVTILMLFFFHGAKLAREQVLAGLLDWRLHLVILACTFVMFPLVGLVGSRLFPGLLPPALWTGLLFVCALPSTVQSAIAFVSMARGNVPSAIASASASQMLGIVLTPIIMGLIANTHGGATGSLSGIAAIAAQILLPFLAGHLLRPWIKDWVTRNKTLVGLTDRSTILVAVYGAFSAAVLEGLWHKLSPGNMVLLLVADAVLLAIGLAGTWTAGRLGGFNRADRIAILFCGTKKSLVQGVPMAKILFPGPQGGVILLPIMLFHQIQLMACAFIARRYAAMADAESQATS
ncbi:bile acid:sodium symporter family protein [Sphingomonas nostoxanthinifaciens]|uniref:bile acid:sodium symporter family protein n=1 Tax=Sphingomonas nostoxanthinifaciens TaxID=2872652 RepID=UPI001CC20953|nr:bile acid:sodium symporter family protein [Sphingomonas nostoxanthinifaciens]UAK24956.1 bile acid:sodium symporter [Sphingomonas nostoxanthinifaciens]